jgi:hypothetical protein
MTDTSALIPNQMSLPSENLYNLKASAMRCKNYRCSIPASNSQTFAPLSTSILMIPARRNCYLDTSASYLKFTLANKDGTNSLQFDGCGASVINRIDTFHASSLLSSIQQYNVLYNYILDMSLNESSRKGLSAAYGFDSTTNRKGATIAANAKHTVCLPILGPMGLGADKYIPLSFLADDCRIEISWASQLEGMFYSSATSPVAWEIQNVEFIGSIIELSDEAENYVKSITPPNQPIYLHYLDWRHYVSTTSVGISGQYSTLVPARYASLKGIHLLPRNSDGLNVANAYTVSSRVNPNFSTIWWRCGAQLIPSRPVILEGNNVAGYAEGFEELVKAWHSISSPRDTQITLATYNVADSAISGTPVTAYNAIATGFNNAFAIGQELEGFANKDSLLMSGLNTLQQNVFFEATINTATGGSRTYVLNFYANFDGILVLQDGLFSTRF